jgi:hypothetical protein
MTGLNTEYTEANIGYQFLRYCMQSAMHSGLELAEAQAFLLSF